METSDKEHGKSGYAEKFANDLKQNIEEGFRNRDHHSNSGRVLAGMFVVIGGSIFLAKELGVSFPEWVFTWPMYVIAFGIFLGAKHSFRSGGWIGVIAIGGAFLIGMIYPEISIQQYIFPILVITIGLLMIIRPKKRKDDFTGHWGKPTGPFSSEPTSDEYIDSVSVFGGNKKNIITKDFKGGDIVSFFGGHELNLSQADFTGSATLEITNFFAGTKLIVPANWRIKSELVTVFGSFEDKRPLTPTPPDSEKILVLRGTCVFAGIEVKSY